MSKKNNIKVRGIYASKPKKKKHKKSASTKELIKKDKKKRYKRANCNHIDLRTGKTVIKKIDNKDPNKPAEYRCKLCGGKILVEDAPDKAIAQYARDAMYTMASVLRNQYPMNDETHKSITNTLYTNDWIVDRYLDIKDNKGNKNIKNNKKKKKNKKDKDVKIRSRVSY